MSVIRRDWRGDAVYENQGDKNVCLLWVNEGKPAMEVTLTPGSLYVLNDLGMRVTRGRSPIQYRAKVASKHSEQVTE